ncbi:hypothetical protein KR009_003697, partial [Drosophila setifemur]
NSGQETTVWLQTCDERRSKCQVNRFQPLIPILRMKYSEARGAFNGQMRLKFDGQVIKDHDTCESLDLAENDLIDVFILR